MAADAHTEDLMKNDLRAWKIQCPEALTDDRHLVTDGVIHVDDAESCARWASSLERIVAWLRARPKPESAQPLLRAVHVLWRGLALCADPKLRGVPADWPDKQLWVSLQDAANDVRLPPEDQRCAACFQRAATCVAALQARFDAPAEASSKRAEQSIDYPEHVECPGCRQRRKVLRQDNPAEGWVVQIETHDIVDTQTTFDGRQWCTIAHVPGVRGPRVALGGVAVTLAATDLDDLRDRLRVALPQLSIEKVELEHEHTRAKHTALSIETPDRRKDHVYRMVVAIIDGRVNFFVHVHGVSKDLTTKGTQHYSKECASVDEVFAIVCGCWADGGAS